MGRTTPSISMQLNNERNALNNFRRALRKEDQLAFDEMWVHVYKHLMAVNHANHLLPFETYLLAMLLEEHKEMKPLKKVVDCQ
jgi:hypothetical protein